MPLIDVIDEEKLCEAAARHLIPALDVAVGEWLRALVNRLAIAADGFEVKITVTVGRKTEGA